MSRNWRKRAPHVAAALDYAAEVEAGKVPACLYVRQACRRQLEDLERAGFPYFFDVAAAQKVCEYIERMPHVKGEWARRGEFLRLQPWQCFAVTTIFGWQHLEDVHDERGVLTVRAGTRRFRTAYLEMPRKQAKTTLAAAVGNYMVEADGEHGAEVYSSATTRNQAKLVFEVAKQMARRATSLDVRVHNINCVATASKFEPLHAQGETLDGFNISCAINDELHAWKKRSVYDVIETATGARLQPLIFNITTAGDNLEGVCFDLRGYGVRILNRVIADEGFFAIIYTIDDEDKERWLEPEVWRKANPNWGVSVYPMDMHSLAKKARELPSEQNAFLTKRLDVWVNSSVAWMDMLAWARGFDPRLKLDDFRGLPCFAGIDLASKVDVNSLALVFSRNVNGVEHYYVFMRHWLPEAAVAGDRFGLYDGWVRSGHITKTPGNVVDVDAIEEETERIAKAHKLVDLGVDPGHNSTQYGYHMAQRGLKVVDVRPTVLNFSEPMKWLEAWVKDGRLHFSCPVLTWMVSNVVAHRNAKDEIYPRKENSSRKIDGVVALLIAINRMVSQEQRPKHQIFFVG